MDPYVTKLFSTSTALHTSVASQPILSSFRSFLSLLSSAEDPKSFQQAVKCQLWIDAMNLELTALEENDTWDITVLPPNKKSIGCKWLWKIKFKAKKSD